MWKIEQRDGDFVVVVEPVVLEVDEEHRQLLRILAELNGRSIEEELRGHLRRYPEREDEDDGFEPGDLWDLAEVSIDWSIFKLLTDDRVLGFEEIDSIGGIADLMAEAHTGEWGGYPAAPDAWDAHSAELVAALRAGSLLGTLAAAEQLRAIDFGDEPVAA